MAIFYKPDGARLVDVIPYYWGGKYHLFYLHNQEQRDAAGEGIPWAHLITEDGIHFDNHGVAIHAGKKDEQDMFVFTGSVIEKSGVFHAFYTAHNHFFRQEGKPQQMIYHAASTDLMTWQKDEHNPILVADSTRYEVHDWRDPYVFWNDEVGEYWMLLTARFSVGPVDRRGCIALATSPDLFAWTLQEPFWQPHLTFAHECSEHHCLKMDNELF